MRSKGYGGDQDLSSTTGGPEGNRRCLKKGSPLVKSRVRSVRVAAASLNQTPLDWEGNGRRIAGLLKEATQSAVDLIAFPELCLSGYGCEDAFFSLETASRAEALLGQLLPKTKGLTALLGLPVFFKGAMHNCAAMVQDGKILGVSAKRILPREGVHYEARWFLPWSFGYVDQILLCGQEVPIGDLYFRFGTIGVGVEICEEAWDSIPAATYHSDALDIVLNPSASHFAMGKYQRREALVTNCSRALHVHYVYANLVGLEAGTNHL